jgi:hypothetical protein
MPRCCASWGREVRGFGGGVSSCVEGFDVCVVGIIYSAAAAVAV